MKNFTYATAVTPIKSHGRPCIAGTGTSVHRIAILHNLGHGPEEIVRKYEHLTIAGVHAAVAYYYANKVEVDTEIASDEATAESVENLCALIETERQAMWEEKHGQRP
ncbi:MAG: DUF433 domain-containing protein [Pyrinomonadaceae bacterium]